MISDIKAAERAASFCCRLVGFIWPLKANAASKVTQICMFSRRHGQLFILGLSGQATSPPVVAAAGTNTFFPFSKTSCSEWPRPHSHGEQPSYCPGCTFGLRTPKNPPFPLQRLDLSVHLRQRLGHTVGHLPPAPAPPRVVGLRNRMDTFEHFRGHREHLRDPVGPGRRCDAVVCPCGPELFNDVQLIQRYRALLSLRLGCRSVSEVKVRLQ